SKNTSEDLIYLRRSKFAEKILNRAAQGTAIIGICGGFQMLGEKISDPLKTESDYTELDGLKLLPIETTFTAEKFTRQVTLDAVDFDFLDSKIIGKNLDGYEIHSGQSTTTEKIIAQKNILGTYVHGIFDNDDFRRQILNAVRRKKNLEPLKVTRNVSAEKQKNYERLAKIVRDNLNMDLIYKILGNESKS
nr:cobyric acid synthase CobQ [Selenomonadaceae bacterium]